MKGDFTRSTFNPKKNYSGVRHQQGRVQLDADWNEQGDIEAHLRETAVREVVGPSGAPMDGGGFLIEATVGGGLAISPGCIYVDGILCELPGAVVPILPISIAAPPPSEPATGPSIVPAELATDADTEVQRRQAPEAFTLNVSDADFLRLDIAPGDAVKLFFRDGLYQENEAGPYAVLGIAKQSDVVRVTLRGTAVPFVDEPRLRRETNYLRQPDFPGAVEPSEDGAYLAYLDVWSRHLTYLDDPQIREPALGGPDTATRVKTVCQVRLLPIGGAAETDSLKRSLNCLSKPGLWNAETAPSSGRLRARAQPGEAAPDPCIVPDQAGFRGLENQLYRVEIHEKGDLSQATFKWSQDNGIVATWWIGVPVADTIQVADPGRDAVRGFHQDDWVELIEADTEADGRKHGVLVQLGKIEGDLFTLAAPPLSRPAEIAAWFTAFEFAQKNHTAPPRIKMRRWDGALGAQSVHADSDGWIPLENGVQVSFEPGSFRTGDYWMIPARTFTDASGPGIEWPKDAQGSLLALPPHGIEHHYCKLAVVVRTGGVWSVRGDCRDLFPPLTGLLHLEKLCGDCQEALPGEKLPEPLRLVVLNGGLPMPGKVVRLGALIGSGSLVGEKDRSLLLTTGPDGIVECFWTLGDWYCDQQVVAGLVDEQGDSAGPHLCFTARQIVPVLHQLCGDGQPVFPGRELPGNLAVAVWVNGLRPLPKALVRFEIVEAEGQGYVQAIPEPGQIILFEERKKIEIFTDANGIAQASWFPDTKILTQRVRATLLDKDSQPLGAPVCFTATLNLASQVQYDPAGCNVLQQAGAIDVQKALDELCKRLPPPDRPSFFVENVYSLADRRKVLNDSRVTVDRFAAGLRIACTAPIAPESVAATPGLADISVPPKPACAVVLDVPSRGEMGIFGFWPVLLQAKVSASKSDILWQPSPATWQWLSVIFYHEGKGISALRVCLTLQGNLIWTPGPDGQPAAYLAGKPLGKLGEDKDGRVDLVRDLPPYFEADMAPAARTTGVPVAGSPQAVISTIDELPYLGTEVAEPFTMWFWLVPTPLRDATVQVSATLPAPELQPAPSLADVRGIGPVLRSRLEEAGITQPAEVAAMEPARLAETLRVSETQATALIENAKRVADV